MTNPRRPGARLQARILRDEPDRCARRRRRARDASGPEAPLRAPARRRGIRHLRGPPGACSRWSVPSAPYAGLQYKVPKLVVEEIEASGRFRASGSPRSPNDSAGRSPRSRARRPAISRRWSPATAGWRSTPGSSSAAGSAAHTRSRSIRQAVERLRELGEHHALAFLPSHRSYLDPLVMRSALYRQGFAPNHVLGGHQHRLLADRPGRAAQRRCLHPPQHQRRARLQARAARVHRLSGPQALQRRVVHRGRPDAHRQAAAAALRAAQLPRRRGTRGRRGPGRDAGPDLDRLRPALRGRAMAAEEHGAQKTPESLSWLVGYARAQGRGFGKVRVQLRRAAVADRGAGAGERSTRSSESRSRSAPDQPGDADHRDGDGRVRAAGGRGPRADARGGPATLDAAVRVRATTSAAGHRRARPAHTETGVAPGARGAQRATASRAATTAGSSRSGRSARRATSRRRSTATRRPLSWSTARSPSWCSLASPRRSPRRRLEVGRGAADPRRAQVRVLLRPQVRTSGRSCARSWR